MSSMCDSRSCIFSDDEFPRKASQEDFARRLGLISKQDLIVMSANQLSEWTCKKNHVDEDMDFCDSDDDAKVDQPTNSFNVQNAVVTNEEVNKRVVISRIVITDVYNKVLGDTRNPGVAASNQSKMADLNQTNLIRQLKENLLLTDLTFDKKRLLLNLMLLQGPNLVKHNQYLTNYSSSEIISSKLHKNWLPKRFVAVKRDRRWKRVTSKSSKSSRSGCESDNSGSEPAVVKTRSSKTFLTVPKSPIKTPKAKNDWLPAIQSSDKEMVLKMIAVDKLKHEAINRRVEIRIPKAKLQLSEQVITCEGCGQQYHPQLPDNVQRPDKCCPWF